MERLTGDVDRSNELVVILQEKVKEKEDDIRRLKQEKCGFVEEHKTEAATDINTNDMEVLPTEVQTKN